MAPHPKIWDPVAAVTVKHCSLHDGEGQVHGAAGVVVQVHLSGLDQARGGEGHTVSGEIRIGLSLIIITVLGHPKLISKCLVG